MDHADRAAAGARQSEWKSGGKVWLLDVIAPTRELPTMVLKGFNRVAESEEVSIHPLVAQLVDREVLKQLVSAGAQGSEVSSSPTIN